jgi:hypothetical protein
MELPKEPVASVAQTPALVEAPKTAETEKEAVEKIIPSVQTKRGRPKRVMTEAQIAARDRNLAKGREMKDKKYQLQQKLLAAAERFLTEEMKKETSGSQSAPKEKAPVEAKVAKVAPPKKQEEEPEPEPAKPIERKPEPAPEPPKAQPPQRANSPLPVHVPDYMRPVQNFGESQPFNGYNIQSRFTQHRQGRKIFSMTDLLK